MPQMTPVATSPLPSNQSARDDRHANHGGLATRLVAALMVIGIVIALLPASRVFARQDRFGTDWVVQSTITAAGRINFVYFIDQNDGFVASDSGTVSVTHDGGFTWHIETTASQDTLTDIAFADPSHGFAAGGHTLLTTTDGGQTWHEVVSSSLPSNIVSITVASANSYFVIDDNHDVYATSDYGVTWNQLTQLSAYQMSFSTPTTGWATVQGSDPFLRSTDGGYTWLPVSIGSTTSNHVAFVDARNGYVWGFSFSSSGKIITAGDRTTDGGITWSTITAPGWYLHIVSPTHLMSWPMNDNLLYDSFDGGATWQTETLPQGNVIFAGYRGSVPYVVQSNGAFLHYGSIPTTPAPAPPTATSVPATATVMPLATATSTIEAPIRVPPSTLLRIDGISPGAVIAGSRAKVVVTGQGFDGLATISIGATDITNAVFDGRKSLTFIIPDSLKSGVYDVTVTEPDGSSAKWPQALTVRPFSRLAIQFLHPTLAQGATGVVLIQAPSNAGIVVHPTTKAGKAAARIGVKVAYSARGGWRVLLQIGKNVAPGKYLAQIVARLDNQLVLVSEGFTVIRSTN